MGKQQIISLQKVITYCRDTSLEELQQGDLRKKCLDYWGVPADARKAPPRLPPDEAFSNILGPGKSASFGVVFSVLSDYILAYSYFSNLYSQQGQRKRRRKKERPYQVKLFLILEDEN